MFENFIKEIKRQLIRRSQNKDQRIITIYYSDTHYIFILFNEPYLGNIGAIRNGLLRAGSE